MIGYGLPSLVTTRLMQSMVTQNRLQLDTARIEAVTGRAADLSKATGGNVGKIHLLEKQIADTESRLDAMNLLRSDFSVVQDTLGATRQRVSLIATEIDAAIGLENETSLDALALQAEADLKLVVGSLNVSYGGRQLFSGAKTDTAPIASADQILTDVAAIVAGAANAASVETALDTYFDDPAGTFRATIYQGSTTDVPDRDVSESRRIGVNVKATDLGIRSAIRGLALMAVAKDNAVSDDVSDDIRRGAAATLRISADELISQQSLLGSLESEVQVLQTRGEAVKFTLESSLTSLIGVDQYEAASRMNALETQLEATYLSTTRIANLSLVNFLR